MKKVIFLMFCFLFIVTNGFAQSKFKGEKGISSVGGILGYAIESDNAVIGVDYRYNILDKVRLAPSALYIFKKNNTDVLYFNIDAHYLARVKERVTLYPLGGVGVSVWRYKLSPIFENLKVNESETRIGLNLGFGGEVRVTKDIIVGAEFRYNWTKQHDLWAYYNQALLLARVAYYF